MNYRKYFQEIRKLDSLIHNKEAELQQLRDLRYRITAINESEPVQTSHDNDNLGELIAKIIDLQNEIYVDIDRLLDEKNYRIAIIEKIPDAVQYDVLHKRFIQYKSINTVARELSYSPDTIKRIQRHGLDYIEKNILGNVKYTPYNTQ